MRDREPFADEMDDLGPEPVGRWYDEDAASRATAPHVPTIRAAPFVMMAPETIPPRRWLLGRHLLRKFISTTVSPGGIGKSSLAIAETLAMVTGRDLIGHPPRGRFRVWYVNLEDPQEELQRRFVAAASLYGINPEDIAGRLFVNSGRDTPMIVARQDRAGITIAVPVVEAIKATIRENQIDAVVIDPFVSCHEVSENDNGAINTVATIWASIADETDTAIDLIHHSRKTGGGEVQMEDLRGAVALLSKARAGRVLNVMTKEEAEAAGVDERRVHFRVDAGKANLAPPPSEGSSWFKLVSVPLHNGPLGSEGDSVGVVTAWKWPDPFEDITVKDLVAAQRAISQGGPWRLNVQAKEWVGRPIALALRLNPDEKAHREKVKRILGAWIAAGMFVVVPGKNDRGRDTPMVEVGKPATAED